MRSKSGNADFGITVDGTETTPGFPTVKDAEDVAHWAKAQGRKVAIVDKVTKKIIKQL